MYLSKWTEKGIVSVKNLLKEDGSYLLFQEFKGKFSCNTNFIQYFQIISAMPNRLQLKERQIESVNNQFFASNDHFFISAKILYSTLIKPNRDISTSLSLIKVTTKVEPVLKDGAKYGLNDEHGQRYLRGSQWG